MVYFIRTGGAVTNRMIAVQAQKLDMALKIYEGGFILPDGSFRIVKSENEIYETLNLQFTAAEYRP